MNALDYVSNRKGKCVVSAGKFVLCCVTSVPIQCLILTRHDTILTELEVISSPVLVSCSDVSMKHILQWVVREGISPFYPGIAITVPVELHRTTSFRLTHTICINTRKSIPLRDYVPNEMIAQLLHNPLRPLAINSRAPFSSVVDAGWKESYEGLMLRSEKPLYLVP